MVGLLVRTINLRRRCVSRCNHFPHLRLRFIVLTRRPTMATVCYRALRGAACLAVLALAACAQQGQDEMSWARAALARNDRIEVVSADQQSRTFTVRVKDTGELRMMRADELIAGPALPAKAPAVAAAADTAAPAATAPVSADNGPLVSAGEAAAPEDSSAPSSRPAATPQAAAGGGGGAWQEGPGS